MGKERREDCQYFALREKFACTANEFKIRELGTENSEMK